MVGASQVIDRGKQVTFGDVQWLSADDVDPLYLDLLPAKGATLSTDELAFCEATFGPYGEVPVTPLN